jgi:hypothetical protein
VEFFKYSWQPPASIQTDSIAFWTCNERWIERYNQQGYLHNKPKMRYAENNHLPIFWDANLIKAQLAEHQLIAKVLSLNLVEL